jgi:hypothetical protein
MLWFCHLFNNNQHSMCFSATVSYSAAAILTGTGIYAMRQARGLPPAFMLWAAIPIFFAVQQAFEGRVWQMLAAGNASEAVPYALGFHFFSHFLWLWLIPLSSYLIEPEKIRKRVFAGCAMFGAFAGSLVYASMLFNPEWMNISVRDHSIIYDFNVPYQSTIHLPITPLMLYGLTLLLPLFFSSHRQIKIFGILLVLSMVLAGEIKNHAFVSVWCFFAAVLSLYLVYMIRKLAAAKSRQ